MATDPSKGCGRLPRRAAKSFTSSPSTLLITRGTTLAAPHAHRAGLDPAAALPVAICHPAPTSLGTPIPVGSMAQRNARAASSHRSTDGDVGWMSRRSAPDPVGRIRLARGKKFPDILPTGGEGEIGRAHV